MPLQDEPRVLLKLLDAEVRVLREMLAAMRDSRDSWRGQAERAALALIALTRQPSPLALAAKLEVAEPPATLLPAVRARTLPQ